MLSLSQHALNYCQLVLDLVCRLFTTWIALILSPIIFILDRRATSRTRAIALSARVVPDTGRAVFLTGASAGIGRALALAFAAHRTPKTVALYLTGRNAGRLQETVELCRAAAPGVRVKGIELDVTDAERTKDAIYAAHENEKDAGRPSGLDVVVANAGIAGPTSTLQGMDVAREIFQVNVTGTVNTVVPAAEMFTRGEGEAGVVGEMRSAGSIVIVSSLSSYSMGVPFMSSYGASKVAQRFYGEALSAGLEGSGVDVLVVCPSFVDTDMAKVVKNVEKIATESLSLKIISAVDERGVGVLDVVTSMQYQPLLYAISHLPLPYRRTMARQIVRSTLMRGQPRTFARHSN